MALVLREEGDAAAAAAMEPGRALLDEARAFGADALALGREEDEDEGTRVGPFSMRDDAARDDEEGLA